MSEEKKDLQKTFAMLSQEKAKGLPEGVKTEYFTVPYLDHEGEIKEAKGCLYLPDRELPMPLVYVSHYKITEDAVELSWYLKEGWAVACPWNAADPNTEVARDGLVSNSALLYALRHRPEVDASRIAITGGSAGGYMGMMLSVLHLCGCVSFLKGVPGNYYFNFKHYAPYTAGFNLPALLSMKDEERADLMTMLSKLPIPFAAVFSTFRTPELDELLSDEAFAAAVSPILLANCLSNPLMETHNTSDILVPVDQITRSFTYDHVSADLPVDYKIHLKDFDLPEQFDRSLTEVLQESSFTERLLPLVPVGETADYPFDEKPFQINIYDEGEPNSRGSHGTGLPAGLASEIAFLRHYFEIGSRAQFLTEEKIDLLVERYEGRSKQFPLHEGKEEIYGSIAMYRREIREEVEAYAASHPGEALPEKLAALI